MRAIVKTVGIQTAEIHILMMNGDEIQRAVLSVNVRDELRNLTLQLGRVGKSRGCDLDEDNMADPLGIILQKLLERTELASEQLISTSECAGLKASVYLLHNTLNDVKLVSSDNDLLSGIQSPERLKLGLDTRTSQVALHSLGVHAHRAPSDAGDVALNIDASTRCRLISAYTDTARREVSGV